MEIPHTVVAIAVDFGRGTLVGYDITGKRIYGAVRPSSRTSTKWGRILNILRDLTSQWYCVLNHKGQECYVAGPQGRRIRDALGEFALEHARCASTLITTDVIKGREFPFILGSDMRIMHYLGLVRREGGRWHLTYDGIVGGRQLIHLPVKDPACVDDVRALLAARHTPFSGIAERSIRVLLAECDRLQQPQSRKAVRYG